MLHPINLESYIRELIFISKDHDRYCRSNLSRRCVIQLGKKKKIRYKMSEEICFFLLAISRDTCDVNFCLMHKNTRVQLVTCYSHNHTNTHIYWNIRESQIFPLYLFPIGV